MCGAGARSAQGLLREGGRAGGRLRTWGDGDPGRSRESQALLESRTWSPRPDPDLSLCTTTVFRI